LAERLDGREKARPEKSEINGQRSEPAVTTAQRKTAAA